MSIDNKQHIDESDTGEVAVTDVGIYQSGVERRSSNRTRDDVDWESKVVARLHGRLRDLALSSSANQSNPPADSAAETLGIGWETTVLDVLRRRIERGPS